MDEIRIEIESMDQYDGRGNEVSIFVNSRDLIEVISDIEQPFAEQEDNPELAGSYRGLPPDEFFTPVWQLLTTQETFDRALPSQGTVTVLRCKCGEVACWPLRVEIIVDEETVTWNEFEQPHRPKWDYTGLSFTFSRPQYEVALVQQ